MMIMTAVADGDDAHLTSETRLLLVQCHNVNAID